MSDLSTLKAGDKVLTTHGGYRGLRVVTVDKVTKIHAIVGGSKYRLRDGWLVGGGAWSNDYIKPYSEQEWGDYQRELAELAIMRALRDFNWQSLDIKTARKIHALLPKAEVKPHE